MKKGDIGAPVADLQRRLNGVGLKIAVNAVFGAETEAAVMAFQKRAGLIVDGWVGVKTLAALASGERNNKNLSEQDLEKVAARLGVPVASVKAVNAVESNGRGFLEDGRPVILYERHVMYRQLGAHNIDPAPLTVQSPTLVNEKRGGYVGGAGEYQRLAMASQIHPKAAPESCSWGQFQIMGYHWLALGYESIEAFVSAMRRSEAAQLDAFARFIEADSLLHKSLKAKKWPEFARRYNGPAYKENLYDVKLARAFERFSHAPEAEAA